MGNVILYIDVWNRYKEQIGYLNKNFAAFFILQQLYARKFII